MAIVASQLIANVNVQGAAQASAELLGLGEATNTAAGKLGMLAGGAVLGIGAALVGVGAKAVQMAGDFQSGMTSLVTGAGEAQSNLKMVSDGILQMAGTTGTSAKQLTDGMYMIESAGFHGADGLKVLQAAAEGAKVGNADLGTVASAVTTVMHDYANSHYSAVQATNALITTVASGKTKLQDLAGSMSAVLPLAASLHIPFEQVAGAMATMTNAGMSAQNASHNLAFAIRAMDVESGPGAKALMAIGLSAQQLHNTLTTQGLPAALQMVEDHIGKKWPLDSAEGQAALKAIMGGAAGLNVALMLSGSHMKEFEGDVSSIGGALRSGSKDVQGWSLIQSNFNQKMDQAKGAAEALMIKLGTALLPTVGKIVDAVTQAINNFIAWEDKTHGIEAAIATLKTVITDIATAISTAINFIQKIIQFFKDGSIQAQIIEAVLIGIGVALAAMGLAAFVAAIPALVAGFIAWAVAAGSAAIATLAAAAPFILIGAVIAVVVAAIVLAIMHWSDIVKFLQGVWTAFTSWFMSALKGLGTFFTGVWEGIKTGLQAAWNFIVNVAKVGALLLLAVILGPIIAVVAGFQWLYNHNYYFKDLIDAIVNVVKAGLAWLQSAWNASITWLAGVWRGLVGIASSAWNAVSSAVMGVVNGVVGWLRSTWQAAISALGALWNTLSSLASAAWNGVVAIFRSVWGPISGALSGLWSNISGWFTNLASSAVQWGSNIIQGFINGIKNMASAAGQAAANVVNSVKSFLGFHSPAEKGEGRYIIQWGEGMVKGFAQGVMNAAPLLQNTVNSALGQGTTSLSGASSSYRLPVNQPTTNQQIIVSPPPVYLDGRILAGGLMPHITNAIRYNVGTHTI